MFFFFKHKKADNRRISDWSSDVCSSDLLKSNGETAMVLGTMTDADYEGLRKMQDRSAQANFMFPIIASGRKYFRGTLKRVGSSPVPMTVLVNGKSPQLPRKIGKASWRERVWPYVENSVVDCTLKKKNKRQ